jgi:hypothetical protein
MTPLTSQTALLFGHDGAIWSGVEALEYVRGERQSWRD